MEGLHHGEPPGCLVGLHSILSQCPCSAPNPEHRRDGIDPSLVEITYILAIKGHC
jgi:hypothetical protein